MIFFLNQILLATSFALCAWGFVFALLGHKFSKEGESFGAEEICGKFFDLYLFVYPLALVTSLSGHIASNKILLLAVSLIGYIVGYILIKIDSRSFFKMIAIFLALESLVLVTLADVIAVAIAATLSTTIVALYLFYVAIGDESVRNLIYKYSRYFRLVVWIGLVVASPLYIGSLAKDILLAIIILCALIISGPFDKKISYLAMRKKGTASLTGKWGGVYAMIGSVVSVSWFLIYYLQLVNADLSNLLVAILFVVLVGVVFLGYRIIEGRAADAGTA